MTAGLPGFALGGLFFVISALCMPFVELVRAAGGRSSRARWRFVARHTGIATGIVVSVERVVWLVTLGRTRDLAAGGAGGETDPVQVAATIAFPVVPVLLTVACLALVLLCSYVLLLLRGSVRPAETPDAATVEARDAA
ncbi:MAG TPA: hypothetical protein VM573_05465 [Actinomycetota bacterium]|nr:hypothetical protein [Actinomycetota bacterium]